MIKLVAFDWNGTLFADTNLSVKACSDILEHFGYPRTTIKEYRDKFTIPIRNFWINMGLDPVLFDREGETIESIFLKSYEPLEKRARSRAGAREILKWFHTQNIKAIIYSNHIVPHIQK